MRTVPGPRSRRLVPAAALLVLALGTTACGGGGSDSDSPVDPVTPSSTPTVDRAAADQAALEKLVTDFWAVRTSSQNTGNTSPDQFADVLTAGLVEVETGTLSDYKKLKIVRKGEPRVTDVEVTASGDTGEVLACVDEDGWTAEQDGKPVELGQKGSKAWGATTERSGDAWIISDFLTADESAGKKSC